MHIGPPGEGDYRHRGLYQAVEEAEEKTGSLSTDPANVSMMNSMILTGLFRLSRSNLPHSRS